MKNVVKLFGIIVLVAVMAFAACDGDGGGGGGNPNPNPNPGGSGEESLGTSTLTISNQQVYQWTPGTTVFPKYNGSGNITGNWSNLSGVSGSITGGRLSLVASQPNQLQSLDNFFYYWEQYSNLQINPSDARGAYLEILSTDISGMSNLRKFRISSSGSVATMVDIFYLFVDRDTTITAPEGSYQEQGNINDLSSINLNLRQGWNALAFTITAAMSESNVLSTYSITLGNDVSALWTLIHQN